MHSYYTRAPRAAVAVSAASDHEAQPSQPESASRRPSTQTLWASRPLAVRAGRLVAVRLRGDDLQVALASADGLRWVTPLSVLSDAQAQRWASTSSFVEKP